MNHNRFPNYYAVLFFIVLSLCDKSSSFLSQNTIAKSSTIQRNRAKKSKVSPTIFASSTTTTTGTSPEDDDSPWPAGSIVKIEKMGVGPIGDPLLLTSGVLGIASWIFVSYLALSRHPVPAIHAAASTRHNAFTIAQAVTFPVAVLSSVVATLSSNSRRIQNEAVQTTTRRLSLGLAIASFWTAAAVFFGPTFSVGYDLFSNPFRYGGATIFSFQGLLGLVRWKQARGGSVVGMVHGGVRSLFDMLSPNKKHNNDSDDNDSAALYAFGSLGLLILALLPQMVRFPTATIPTLLGKRLSRTASGFTLLGSVAAFSLQKEKEQADDDTNTLDLLRRGLGIGSALHVGLVAAKLIGLDGGGLLLPGRGLWQDYPSLVGAATPATVLMMVTYSVLAIGCFSGGREE
jgi:hypothetical protein